VIALSAQYIEEAPFFLSKFSNNIFWFLEFSLLNTWVYFSGKSTYSLWTIWPVSICFNQFSKVSPKAVYCMVK
jgi:hypothetical protein